METDWPVRWIKNFVVSTLVIAMVWGGLEYLRLGGLRNDTILVLGATFPKLAFISLFLGVVFATAIRVLNIQPKSAQARTTALTAPPKPAPSAKKRKGRR